MAPTIVFDGHGRLYAIVGSPGGSNIIQYVVKTLIGIIDWDLNIQQAVDLGNFGAQPSATTSLESGSSVEDLGPGLQALGHTGVGRRHRLGHPWHRAARQPDAPRGGMRCAACDPCAAGPEARTRAAKEPRTAIDTMTPSTRPPCGIG